MNGAVMIARPLALLALAAVLVLVLAPSTAHAIDRNCPKGQTWSISQGTCVKKRPAPRLSPEEKYDRANDHLEGRGKAPDPRRGVRLLEENCAADHGPSCNLLGFLHARGRSGVARDEARAMELFVRACKVDELEGCFNIGDLAYRTGKYADAQTAFKRACELGSGIGCARGADLIERGIGGKAAPQTAVPMFKRASELLGAQCPANSTSCFVLGFLSEHGKGIAKHPGKALDYYRQGCNGGHGEACMALANGLDRGIGGNKDEAGANQAYEKACSRYDNGDACQKIAERLGMAKQDLPRAFELAKRGCTLDPKYCGTLAEFYRLGFGMAAANQPEATRYYKSACESGGLGWCETYGKRAHEGVGGRADKPAARTALERACKGGYASSCGQVAQYLIDDNVDDKRAATLAGMGCDAKHPHSCYLLGYLQRAGRGGLKSPERALASFETGCELGSPHACEGAASAHKLGEGTPADLAKALERYAKGCEGTGDDLSASACREWGLITYWGQGVPKDAKVALAAFSRSCEHRGEGCEYLGAIATEVGAPLEPLLAMIDASCKAKREPACLAYGNQLAQSQSETDRRKAYDTFTAACRRSSKSDACLRQADLLAEGWGITQDLPRAERLYRTRCDGGDARACFGMGRLQFKQDKPTEALKLFVRACEGKVADACSSAGYAYYTAHGVRWDVTEAAKLFLQACELGSSVGCANSGDVYRFGAGAAQDHAKAFAHYDKACRPFDPTGCAGVGHYLATGEGGIEIDRARAEQALRAACTQVDVSPEACRELADLLEQQRKGTPAEIARLRTTSFTRAQELAKDNPYYMYILGTFYAAGMATVKDPAAALTWMSKSCDGFDPLGCIAGGQALQATGKPEDAERARVYFERACAAGVNDGCTLGKAKPPGPPPVAGKAQGCGCAGEVAPGGHAGLALVLLLALRRRRSRA